MPKQRFGLGRGLDALIPGAATVSEDAPMDTGLSNSALFEVSTSAISPNPQQPRMPLGDDQQLLELATSIQEYGLLQPLLVRLDGEDEQGPRYQLIAGERRWRAAQIAGLDFVPVVIRDATPQLMLEMALVENLQRTDLNPLEEAQGYQTLIEEYHLTQQDVADRVGRNRATVANTLRLLQLPAEVREALITMPKVFTEGHARAVMQVNGDTERITLTKQIIAQMMSVRQAEEMARRYNEISLHLTPDRRGGRVRQQSYDTRQLEEEFIRAVEMKVRLQRSTKGKGSLTLYFSNDDQLQTLYERLVGPNGNGLLNGDGNGNGNGASHALDVLLGDGYADVGSNDGSDN
jgi:ParB family chromosome partitioning protein